MSEVLKEKIKLKKAKICVIGLGYVGLPLAVEYAIKGYNVHGIDTDITKIKLIHQKKNYIKDVVNKDFLFAINNKLFTASEKYDKLGEQDIIFICVPTPVNENKTPDISCIMSATEEIYKRAKKHCMVILKSTTFPGTTEECVMPVLEKRGWKVGKDFHLAFSPERVDPGNKTYNTSNTPVVVGGVTKKCLEAATLVLQDVASKVHQVSSPKAAEMSKLLENIFRSVNIALVNEMARLCDRMGNVNIWEVIEAAATKPFGFMPFYPGPGIGGHCIQIDPYYLDWRAKKYDFHTKFVELAAESNEEMPFYVRDMVIRELAFAGIKTNDANVLILGTTFKKDVEDSRNSPAIKIIELLYKEGITNINFHDPYMRNIRLYDKIFRVQELNEKLLKDADITVIVTDHSSYDYEWIVDFSKRVIDTRNATKKIKNREKIVLLGAWAHRLPS
ncbi:MAG: nucleotide sugar dehydrogenase [Ignavibacteria bacterium]|nr:nucleotide sugar dehydrogenase [Ignavibacteria bacterium]